MTERVALVRPFTSSVIRLAVTSCAAAIERLTAGTHPRSAMGPHERAMGAYASCADHGLGNQLTRLISSCLEATFVFPIDSGARRR